jgi:hypothetical protein
LTKYSVKLSILAVIGLVCTLFAQDTTKTLAYKNNRPDTRGITLYQYDLAEKIYNQFNLIRKANEGDPLAQHELGIRYLTGEDFPPDTVKAAFWIKKAALQNLPSAIYNYGILLINGWGVDWNPFEAFNSFLSAARYGMPDAEYIMGQLYTNDLIIKKNMTEAYKWVRSSANKGFPPAKEFLTQLNKFEPKNNDTIPLLFKTSLASGSPVDESTLTVNKKSNSRKKSGKETTGQQTSGLVFINFDTITDSIPSLNEEDLTEDLKNSSETELVNSVKYRKDSTVYIDSTSMPALLEAADYGCPEALNLLGYYIREGIHFQKDMVAAAEFFIRSSGVDSRKGTILLYNLVKGKNFYTDLKKESDKNNPDALYVWYGLQSLGFDHQITEGDAFGLLQKAAAKKNLIAVVELGQDYFKGKYVKQDKEKAVDIWNLAMKSGSKEARIRLEIANLFN